MQFADAMRRVASTAASAARAPCVAGSARSGESWWSEVAPEWWTVEVATDATTEQLCAVVSDPSSPRGAVMSIRVSRQS